MTALRYGLLGAGMMGQEHLKNLALLGAEATAVFEPDDRMATTALQLAPGARRLASADEVVRDPAVDALLIASPNHLHVDQLAGALARRSLPVLVEKPLYTAPSDVARLTALAAGDPFVWVAMEYRYMPPIAAFLAEADRATGGIKMLTIREHRFPFLRKVGDWNRFNRFSGGTLVEKCCHFFDLMRLALNAEPVRVMASAGQAVNHLGERYGGETPDIWDNGYVIVDFDSGARAMLELCMFADGARYQEEISALGPDGKMEAFVPGPTRFWPEHLGEPPVAQVIVSPRSPKGPRLHEVPVDETLLDAGDHNGATFYQHRRFADALASGRAPEVTLADGFAAVAMGLAAQRSAETGQAVAVEPLPAVIGATGRRAA
ncbi:MAG: Gfo/Idh/MocA family oxidoreductase [Pseudomonadota bacterium]